MLQGPAVRTAARVLCGVLLVVLAKVIWFVSPTFHDVEVVNSTTEPWHEVVVRVAGKDAVAVALAPGEHFKHTFLKTMRASTKVQVSAVVNGSTVILADCGYLDALPTRTYVLVSRIGDGASGKCQTNFRTFGWLP